MKYLNDNIEEVRKTLAREKMLVEAVFEEEISGEKYLSWFSVQEEGGETCMTSDFKVDKMHIRY